MSDGPPAVRPGRPWGEPFSGEADLEVSGGDSDLAAAVAPDPGTRVVFDPSPTSQLARAVGLAGRASSARAGRSAAGWQLPLDALTIEVAGGAVPELAVNAVVLGVPPGRLRWWSRSRAVAVRADGRLVHHGPATTVVVANGQYLDGSDAVPRGHPGDGRVEVQVYALGRGERHAMRRRLPVGAHVPHPRIPTTSARVVEIDHEGRWPVRVDGVEAAVDGTVRLSVRTGAYRLVVPSPG